MMSKKKQKQVSIEEYVETYCQEKRIRGRFAVYVSPEVHHNLMSIARLFKNEYHTTTSSLADAIISRHLEAHSELLNAVHRENAQEFIEWLQEMSKRKREEIAEEPEVDDPEEDNSEFCQDNDSEQ